MAVALATQPYVGGGLATAFGRGSWVLPAVGIAVALLLATLAPRARHLVGGGVLAALLAATLIGGTMREKEQWRAALAALAGADPRRDLIVACPFWKAPALMAASRGTRSAPLATPAGASMRLVERHLGATPQWDRLFYERIFRPHNAAAMGMTLAPGARVAVPMARLFVVTSECSREERAAIAGWTGAATLEGRWSSPKRRGHAGIAIERWRLARPRRVELAVAY
jgi:hypothetical protein